MMISSIKTGLYVAAQSQMKTPWVYGPRITVCPAGYAIVLQLGRFSIALGKMRKTRATR